MRISSGNSLKMSLFAFTTTPILDSTARRQTFCPFGRRQRIVGEFTCGCLFVTVHAPKLYICRRNCQKSTPPLLGTEKMSPPSLN